MATPTASIETSLYEAFQRFANTPEGQGEVDVHAVVKDVRGGLRGDGYAIVPKAKLEKLSSLILALANTAVDNSQADLLSEANKIVTSLG